MAPSNLPKCSGVLRAHDIRHRWECVCFCWVCLVDNSSRPVAALSVCVCFCRHRSEGSAESFLWLEPMWRKYTELETNRRPRDHTRRRASSSWRMWRGWGRVCEPAGACVCAQTGACVSGGRFGASGAVQPGRYECWAAASEPRSAGSRRTGSPGALGSKGEERCRILHRASNSSPWQEEHLEDRQESSRRRERSVFVCVRGGIRRSERDVTRGTGPGWFPTERTRMRWARSLTDPRCPARELLSTRTGETGSAKGVPPLPGSPPRPGCQLAGTSVPAETTRRRWWPRLLHFHSKSGLLIRTGPHPMESSLWPPGV